LLLVYSQTAEALTWRDAASLLAQGGHLPSAGASELLAIRTTVRNMARAGELRASGQVRHERCNRPMTAFRLAVGAVAAPSEDPLALLSQVWR
jgi:hypothetical protein